MGACLSPMQKEPVGHTLEHVIIDTDLAEEYENSRNTNRPYVFKDIIDDKHTKYMGSFSSSELFWGIGIENESYFMMNRLENAEAFRKLKQKRERYSVDYYKNFKAEPLNAVMDTLKILPQLTYPIYVNSHTFQNTDPKGEHRTFYNEQSTPNPSFTSSLHDRLLADNPYYRSVYDQSLVFDGDSIEFITQNFHNTTVGHCVQELMELKQRALQEISPMFGGCLQYPDHNFGLVSFLSTKRRQLGICNNGTYHVNITLPTRLENGVIVDRNQFAKEHLAFISCIQMVEPLIVACYGTPDVFSLINPSYFRGSLRVGLSRYISLQTFDTESPVNGKLLLAKKPEDPLFWQNQMKNIPYHSNPSIGYDINFNKFKNHGVEIRFLDWFPEAYLMDLVNFFVLLAQHSLQIDSTLDKSRYSALIQNCIQKGFTYSIPAADCNVVLHDLGLLSVYEPMTAHALLQSISDQLYDLYASGSMVSLLSPQMVQPVIVNYNRQAWMAHHLDLFGIPELILRAEENPLETRTPLVPHDLSLINHDYLVVVESSDKRCYSDEDYRKAGAVIVPCGYWKKAEHAYVLGIKGVSTSVLSTQTHLHFAHCFNQQEGWQMIRDRLRPGRFLDFEYMVDAKQKRVISFCSQSGKIGAYLALMTFHQQHEYPGYIPVLPEFNEKQYHATLSASSIRPRILLIGYGTVGKACKAVVDQFGLECTVWTSTTPINNQVILDHDILIHAIRLHPLHPVQPFLLPSDLTQRTHLSVICDISCDLGNPRNTLPLYDTYTTVYNPIRRITSYHDLIAIPHLPSLEPRVSSDQFSSTLVTLLPSLPHCHITKEIDKHAAVLQRSEEMFRLCCKNR